MLANMDPVSAKQLKDCEFQFQVKGLNFPFQKCLSECLHGLPIIIILC